MLGESGTLTASMQSTVRLAGQSPPARAKASSARSARGAGAKVISVSVERELLARSDTLATTLGITRASLVERGLKAVLAAQGRL